MIFKQAAASILLASLLILGSPDAAFGRLRGGIKGDNGMRRILHENHENHSRELKVIPPDVSDVTSGIVTDVDHNIEEASFDVSFSASDPVVFANMMTSEGPDTSDTRVHGVTNNGFSVFVQEETSKDGETLHWATEDIGYMAFDFPGSETAAIRNEAGQMIGIVGKSFTVESQTVGFITWEYPGIVDGSQYVAIVMPNSYTDGEDPVHIRITNIGVSTGKVTVDFNIEEWDYQEDEHAPLDLVYMIVKVGVQTLPNGNIIEAKLNTSVDENSKWIDFRVVYEGPPVVLSQSQTIQETDPIVTRMEGATDSGIMVRVQEEEDFDGIHAGEVVGLIVYGPKKQ